MTRSDDVINEDGHDVIATHTRVVRGMAAALAAIAATGAGVTAAAANVMFTFALDTKAKRSMFNMPHEETPKGIEFDMSEQLEAARWFEEAKQSVTLRSHDGLKLHGWLLDPDVPTHSRIYTRSAAMAMPESPRKWPNGRIAMRNSVLRSCYPRSAPMS